MKQEEFTGRDLNYVIDLLEYNKKLLENKKTKEFEEDPIQIAQSQIFAGSLSDLSSKDKTQENVQQITKEMEYIDSLSNKFKNIVDATKYLLGSTQAEERINSLT